jgi:hypothetical protein
MPVARDFPMHIKFAPTFRDYWTLQMFALGSYLRWLIPFAVLSAVAFASAQLLDRNLPGDGSTRGSYPAHLSLLILPGIIAFILVTTYWAAQRRWAAAEELREEHEYEIDETGVRVRTKNSEIFCEWSIFKKAVITDPLVYLITAQGLFHYFPTRMVADIRALGKLLEAKIGSVKYKMRSQP